MASGNHLQAQHGRENTLHKKTSKLILGPKYKTIEIQAAHKGLIHRSNTRTGKGSIKKGKLYDQIMKSDDKKYAEPLKDKTLRNVLKHLKTKQKHLYEINVLFFFLTLHLKK